MKRWIDWLGNQLTQWLMHEGPHPTTPLCDFNRLRFELRPGDVVLVEGRSRLSEVIKLITQSPWSHAALYIGRLFDIHDRKLRAWVEGRFEGDPGQQMIVEAMIGQGTFIAPLSKYRHEHLRICRPEGLSPDDAQKVIGHAIHRVGLTYDVRQLLDLARFCFPWTVLPRRWRSSLFQPATGKLTGTVCSTLLAEAFNAVDFPILPFIERGEDGSLRFFKRNPKLFAPRDFDYSPYFNIIKYPYLGMADIGLYRRLPWSLDDVVHNDEPPDTAPTPAAPEPISRVARETTADSPMAVALAASMNPVHASREVAIGHADATCQGED